jgi:hypothetical protein
MTADKQISVQSLVGMTSPPDLGRGFLTPSLFRSLFWRPRYGSASTITEHAPFLFWLVGAMRPERVAVLGAGEGDAHFLFCQAIEKHQISAKCFGFGFWRHPKTKVPIARAPNALSEYSDKFYPDISVLMACESRSEAIASIEKKSIDVLFVDLYSLIDDSFVQMEDWEDLLVEGSVLIINGIGNLKKRKNYGESLAKQISKLKRIEYMHGSDLGVFLVGKDPPLPLSQLLNFCDKGVLAPEFSVVFQRLGQGLSAIEGIKNFKKSASLSSKALSEAKEALIQHEKDISSLRMAHENRSRILAETQSAMFDIQNIQDQYTNNIEDLNEEIKSLREERKLIIDRKNITASELDSAILRSEETQKEIEIYKEKEVKYFDEINKNEKIIRDLQDKACALEAERDEALKALEAERQARQSETSSLTQSCRDLQDKACALEAERDEALKALEAERQDRFFEIVALSRDLPSKKEETKVPNIGHLSRNRSGALFLLNKFMNLKRLNKK